MACLMPLLNDQTFSSHIMFVTQNVWRPNGRLSLGVEQRQLLFPLFSFDFSFSFCRVLIFDYSFDHRYCSFSITCYKGKLNMWLLESCHTMVTRSFLASCTTGLGMQHFGENRASLANFFNKPCFRLQGIFAHTVLGSTAGNCCITEYYLLLKLRKFLSSIIFIIIRCRRGRWRSGCWLWFRLRGFHYRWRGKLWFLRHFGKFHFKNILWTIQSNYKLMLLETLMIYQYWIRKMAVNYHSVPMPNSCLKKNLSMYLTISSWNGCRR